MININEAIDLCQWLEPQLAEKHIHCALTGSVLFRGKSNHDIDLICYAHNERAQNGPREIFAVLKKIFPSLQDLGEESGYPGQRLVCRTNDFGHKIDIFIMVDVGLPR